LDGANNIDALEIAKPILGAPGVEAAAIARATRNLDIDDQYTHKKLQ
jgi:hypothetical protein